MAQGVSAASALLNCHRLTKLIRPENRLARNALQPWPSCTTTKAYNASNTKLATLKRLLPCVCCKVTKTTDKQPSFTKGLILKYCPQQPRHDYVWQGGDMQAEKKKRASLDCPHVPPKWPQSRGLELKRALHSLNTLQRKASLETITHCVPVKHKNSQSAYSCHTRVKHLSVRPAAQVWLSSVQGHHLVKYIHPWKQKSNGEGTWNSSPDPWSICILLCAIRPATLWGKRA